MAINKSLTVHGGKVCTGACTYCSAASSQNYLQPQLFLEKDKWPAFLRHVEETQAKTAKYDWDNFVKTWNNDRYVIQELEAAKKQNRNPECHFDIWYFNPMSAFSVMKTVVNKMKELFPEWKFSFSTSDNGVGILGLDDPHEKLDWLIENNITLQLSHDGYGEWLRMPFDPLVEEPYASLWMEALEKGVWTSTNCTLSFYNYSFFKNLEYFNKILNKSNRVHYLKLNHVYDSDYNIEAINVDGRWQDTTIEELKGKPIGKWQLHNGENEWDKHVLDDYIQEFIHLALLCKDPTQMNNLNLKHVRAYITEQASRFRFLKSHDEKVGACRAFQRFQHSIGDPKGWDDQTFVIDTLGKYSVCNLIDSDYDVENPGGVQPEYCKGCKYELAAECNGCGSKNFPSKCEYSYRFEQALEMLSWVNGYTGGIKKDLKNRIFSIIK